MIPHEPLSEQAILATVLLKPETFPSVTLEPRHFHVPANRAVWDALKRLSASGDPFDLALVAKQSGVTISELGRMLDGVATAKPEAHERRIKSAWARRELIRLGHQVTAHAESGDSREILESLGSDLDAIYREFEQRVFAWPDALEATYEEICRLASSREAPGLSSGMSRLDRHIGGFRPGRLYVLGARPGIGKTAFQCNLAWRWIKQSKKFFWSSLEMHHREIVCRILSLESGVSGSRIANTPHELTSREMTLISEACSGLNFAGAVIWDDPVQTTEHLALEVARNKPDALLVDYLQLLDTRQRFDSRIEKVAKVTRDLKAIAKKFDIPVFATAQSNREAEDKRPSLRHFAESSQLEKEADVAMFLHEDKGRYELLIAKNRQGRSGIVELVFDGENMRFSEGVLI